MNHRWAQDLLVIVAFTSVVLASCMDDDAVSAPTIPQVMEQAKQASLSDASKNELALYRQGKFLTTFGDNR